MANKKEKILINGVCLVAFVGFVLDNFVLWQKTAWLVKFFGVEISALKLTIFVIDDFLPIFGFFTFGFPLLLTSIFLFSEAAEKHGSNYFPLSASEGGSFQGLGYFDNLP
ncbi:MAG: hypothetical protein QF787_17645 [Nitrospinota bacterium]|nr:hypothetical protein [Nitrospinota bacterium]